MVHIESRSHNPIEVVPGTCVQMAGQWRFDAKYLLVTQSQPVNSLMTRWSGWYPDAGISRDRGGEHCYVAALTVTHHHEVPANDVSVPVLAKADR